jgi:hypothetical protein
MVVFLQKLPSLTTQDRQVVKISTECLRLKLHPLRSIRFIEEIPCHDHTILQFDGSVIEHDEIHTVHPQELSQPMLQRIALAGGRFLREEDGEVIIADWPSSSFRLGAKEIDQD